METALVTGATSGIGQAAATQLAHLGWHVVVAGRSPQKTAGVVDDIVTAGGSAEAIHLDLASLESCRNAASAVDRVDVLINNAGVGVARGTTTDGFEIHFGVNHLGHFLLTTALLAAMSPGARVVTVSSAAHERARGIDFASVRGRTRSLLGLQEYATSKLANILFTRELARRHPQLRTHAVHPGFTDTAIIPRLARPFLGRSLIPAEAGADTVVWCATSSDVENDSGGYYARRRSLQPSIPARDDALAAALWDRSEEYCGPLG
jgi:NAD(P)-dependent dehydrogenase (short-subunit alcohol dehydrogenase family)